MGFKLNKHVNGAHFEGLLTTLCGYCVIGFNLVVMHKMTSFFKFKKSSRIFGLCYVVVKVSLLLVIEIVAFPVICGWWLDICSLSLFDATLKDRQASYHQSPMVSIFMVRNAIQRFVLVLFIIISHFCSTGWLAWFMCFTLRPL